LAISNLLEVEMKGIIDFFMFWFRLLTAVVSLPYTVPRWIYRHTRSFEGTVTNVWSSVDSGNYYYIGWEIDVKNKDGRIRREYSLFGFGIDLNGQSMIEVGDTVRRRPWGSLEVFDACRWATVY